MLRQYAKFVSGGIKMHSLVNINIERLGSQKQKEVIHSYTDQDFVASSVQRRVWLSVDLCVISRSVFRAAHAQYR